MKKDKKREIIMDLIVVVMSIIVFFIVTRFLCTFVKIEGSSMESSLKDNYRGLSFYYDLDNIQRFDVVVIERENEKTLIKRVIGLPGEEIEYKNNKLYVDGNIVEEYFLDDNVKTEDLDIILKDNEYYCLGDNRELSNDSRIYGPFSKDNIVTSHLFIFYPFNKIGFVK